MERRPQKVNFVTYVCEDCSAQHTGPAGFFSDGMCRRCGFPMKIDDLFADRRIVSVPVLFDRRSSAEAEAA